jgi:F420-non-reducing hydrogenase iron-sulfur subunit
VVEETWNVLKLFGIDERYLRLKWISASEGAIFAEEVRSFTQLLKEMGRNPLAETNGSSPSVAQAAG